MNTPKKEIALEHPITHDGKIYRSVMLTRMKGIDLKKMASVAKDDPDEAETFMFARICGMPIEVFKEMDADDYIAVMKVAQDFLPRRFLNMMRNLEQAEESEQSVSSQATEAEASNAPTGGNGQGSQQPSPTPSASPTPNS